MCTCMDVWCVQYVRVRVFGWVHLKYQRKLYEKNRERGCVVVLTMKKKDLFGCDRNCVLNFEQQKNNNKPLPLANHS